MNVLGLRNKPMNSVRVGFIGLGKRGLNVITRYSYIKNATIIAICDLSQDIITQSLKILEEKNIRNISSYYGEESAWRKVCEREDIDLIYICSDWNHHVEMALYAMEKGKHVAIEVPAAQTLEEIWSLIDMSEKSRKHCFMLEKCCYDFFELTILNMIQKGILGEIIHTEGGYCHNLDPYWAGYWNNWRLNFNKNYRGDIYPTHGIGPLCQMLNIHRGDKMTHLVSMDTKAINGPKHFKAITGKECEYFANGDLTLTLIKTQKEKTILIEHDVMTPRPYSRRYQIVGTDGFASKYPIETLCLRKELYQNKEIKFNNLEGETILSGEELNTFLQEYKSPILTPELEKLICKIDEKYRMDFVMDYRLINCMTQGLPLDIDVYDMAEWCCISPLSRLSLENNNTPVEIPDFTRGSWNTEKSFKYAL